ncbi:hypothetical protein [Rubritalea tangerina]|uniref:hypothetical protein n=1 Tax=Rubritalea tangerina TaxID=430798 RepID=UPI00360E0778
MDKIVCRKATDLISPYLKTGSEATCPHRLAKEQEWCHRRMNVIPPLLWPLL